MKTENFTKRSAAVLGSTGSVGTQAIDALTRLGVKIDLLTANNTALKTQIDNANQTAAVAAMLAPIQKEVSEIKAAQPSTATVQYPQLTAIPSYYLYGNSNYFPYYGGTGSI